MAYSDQTYLLQVGLREEGFDPGPLDGLDGNKTQTALARFQQVKHGNSAILVPSGGTHPPKPTSRAKKEAFGTAGKIPMAYFAPPYEMEFTWGGKVTRIGCHKLIAAPLRAALKELALKGSAWLKEHGLHFYAGCFNFRPARGGSSLSDHAWAVAIDLNPEANGLHETWNPGDMKPNGTREMPVEAVEIFRKHGFQVGFKRTDGSRRDMMHIAYIDRP